MKHQRPVVMTSVLLCLLMIKVVDMISDAIYKIEYPEKRAYPIEGADVEVKGGANEAAKDSGPEDLTLFMKTADAERGKTVAQKCVQCHDFTKGGPMKVGPNLWNTLGSKFAHMVGYSYSKSLQGMSGQWNIDELNRFLYKPAQFVPGTKMTFAGLKKAQDRADVIAYLKTMSDSK